MQYKERLIAFLDILGFKRIIEKTESDIVEFKKLIEVLYAIKNSFNQINSTDENPTDIHISMFSDSIIISASLTCKADIFVSLLLKTNVWLLERGYFVRGGVDYGNIYHKNEIVFGPAFVKAYELEKLADYPRIILSENARKKLHHEKNGNTTSVSMSHIYFKKDCDGLYYVDYFLKDDTDEYKKFIDDLKKNVDENILNNRQNQSILKKMMWIKNKICLSEQEKNKIGTVDDFLESFDCNAR